MLVVQEDIAGAIAGQLRRPLRLEEHERLARRYTEDAEAYQLYLQGRYWFNKRSPEAVAKGIGYFEQAIARDPEYALAHSGLADSYHVLAIFGDVAPPEARARTRVAALRATAIDDTLAEAHASLAKAWFQEWNWQAAEREFHRAMELDPGYANAPHWYASLLVGRGRLPEAETMVRRALGLDPLSLPINTHLAYVLYYTGRNDEAIEQARKCLEMEPGFHSARVALGRALSAKRMNDAAIAELKKAAAESHDHPLALGPLGWAYAAAGRGREARQVLAELGSRAQNGYAVSYWLAAVHLGLGEKSRAFEYLERAYAEQAHWLCYLRVDPTWAQVRSDPRYLDILRRIGAEG